ncbi:hypothetical protein Syun_015619 [Stephania yunnanensis]|uniref:RRM domain-containing protein n=1 Tax=Stephania yunnanensis TaxID=152371 RepID=A0AAP0JLV6_9MAGN
MGKNKKSRPSKDDNNGENQHSPSTIFVSNLPYSFTNSQLEEAFSDVGPVRRIGCAPRVRVRSVVSFDQCDADRAIEMKNGVSVGGRKISVKHALHRRPLEERKAKEDQDDVNAKDGGNNQSDDVSKDAQTSNANEKGKVKGLKKAAKVQTDLVDKADCSEKQRVARTVIFGGLVNADMAEEVSKRCKEAGTILEDGKGLSMRSRIFGSIHVCFSFTAWCRLLYVLQVDKHSDSATGLARDGCRVDASAILFASVKAARASVALLHQQEIKGGHVWARQLGGEGSKTQKWKLIVRNIPFKATVKEIKETFSSAGFVWDIFIPHNAETGLSKGFAFVTFTCKQDAENAIRKVNGKLFGKRPIAVDWAVPKKMFTAGTNDTNAIKDEKHESTDVESGSESDDVEDHAADGELDFDEEANVAKRVLENLMTSSAEGITHSLSSLPQTKEKLSAEPKKVSSKIETKSLTRPLPTPPEQTKGEDDLERTIFISNLPFDIDAGEVKQRFSAFGEVSSFVPVLHPITKRPRGTGFLKFKTSSAVEDAISAANTESGLGIFSKGRLLTVLKALDKKSAHEKEVEKTKKVEHDHRNLYLAKEGVILAGSSAAEGVSESDMMKRQVLEKKKTDKLRSPNFHVSRNRIVIYNLPKTMTEKELKKLCIDAVISRASKQNPVIRQIKYLKDSKERKASSKNYSRGVAFVEFTEHQHALVALRVLNNNPETFGPEKRPIVEFAIDNVKMLKQRNTRLQTHQHGRVIAEDMRRQNDIAEREDGSTTHKGKKRKARQLRSQDKTSRIDEAEAGAGEGAMEEVGPATKKLKHTKRERKGNHKPAEGSTRSPNKQKDEGMKSDMEALSSRTDGAKNKHNIKSKEREEVGMKKRKFKDSPDSVLADRKRSQRKKAKSDPGQEVVDRLDMLIEKYRSKFSTNSSKKTDGEKQASRPLKRWFQT